MHLTSLRELYMQGNRVAELPADFFKMPKLEILNLGQPRSEVRACVAPSCIGIAFRPLAKSAAALAQVGNHGRASRFLNVSEAPRKPLKHGYT